MLRMTPAALAAALLLPLGACSEEDPEPAPPPLNSSYLESLEEEKAPERPTEPDPDPEPDPISEPESDEPVEYEDIHDRELREEEGSRSVFGKTRDRARGLRNEISGGATTDGTRAITGFDEHFIKVRGLKWDVPDPWVIVIPKDLNMKGELLVENELGNAQGLFYVAETDPVSALQQVGRTFSDMMGAPQRPRPQRTEIAGHTVYKIATDGTFNDPNDRSSNDKPFWAIHAVAVEVPGDEDDEVWAIVVLFRGPEGTVQQNEARWEGMIESMRIP